MKTILKRLAWPSLLLAISSMISRLIWVYRDHLLSVTFWASADLDVYYAAFRVPDLIYALLIMASVSTVFLPIFQKYKENNEMWKAWDFTSAVFNTIGITLLILSGWIILIIPFIVPFYVSWFNPAQQEITVTLIRIMMISPFIFFLSSVMISVENAFHKFFTQAIAPILYNIGIVIWIIVFSKHYGLQWLAFGVILWALLQMIIQIPLFMKIGFKWKPILLKGKELKEIVIHATPRILSMSILQISLLVDTWIASTLVVWSVTLINLAENIQSFPFWMISISISITAFASMTKFVAKKDKISFQNILQKSFENTYYWLIPALIWLYLVSEPLINFLFVYKNFSVENAKILLNVFNIYLISLVFLWGIPLLAKSFYAHQKTWITFFISIISVSVNVILNIILSKIYWIYGIALWTVIGTACNLILLIIPAYYYFGKIFSLIKMFKIIISSIIMYFIVRYVSLNIWDLLPIFQLIILSITWGISYLWVNKLIKNHIVN